MRSGTHNSFRPASAPEDAPFDGEDLESAVRAAVAGSREGYGRAVRLLESRVYGLVLMMVRDPAGAEEVAQDTFVRAFTRLDLYDQRRPFYPWIAAIAVRLAQTWLRRHALRTRREGTPLASVSDPPAEGDPLKQIIADESDRRLWRAVAALSSGERTAVYLHYRQEMKVNDIALALGVTTGTIKTLLYRARRKLRRTIPGTVPERLPDSGTRKDPSTRDEVIP